jgi:hypothetical protein
MSPTVGKQRWMKEQASFPWRMLLAGGMVGAALLLTTPDPSATPTTAGRARLTDSIPPGQSGWQVVIDRQAVGWRPEQLHSCLQSLLGVPVEAVPGEGSLWHLRQTGKGSPSVSQEAPPTTPRARDPIFGSGPSVVFEWARGPFNVKGNLYASAGRSSTLVGRLLAVLPFQGISGFGEGFQLDQIGPLPDDLERLLVIDPAVVSFPTTYRIPIQKQWDRWEFFPLKTLGKAVGPVLVYARWRGEALFSIGVKDRSAVKALIDQRFPESVIKGQVRWVLGSRLRELKPDGPAWLLRGDHLLVTRVGGIKRLGAALSDALDRSHRRTSASSELMAELRRLAGNEKGWHLVLLQAEPERQLQWAALLRWPVEESSSLSGFLVVRPAPGISRQARWPAQSQLR